MRVAEKTVAFVKEWINDTFTRRQYQNYYIVKTDHANFLMKLTAQRECMAIRDPSGHIYIWDENGEEDNVFSILVANKDFVWPNGFSRVSSHRLGNGRYMDQTRKYLAVNQISKFRVCERRTIVENPNVNITLMALGEKRFYTYVDHTINNSPVSLEYWANFGIEANYRYDGSNPSATFIETLPNIEKIDQIRGAYLEAAGDRAKESKASEDAWVHIPTNYVSVNDIAGTDMLELRKSRPNPFAYNISHAHFNLHNLNIRFETSEENRDSLNSCFKFEVRRGLPDPQSVDWKEYLKSRFPNDLADRYIAYIEADDAWIEANREVAEANNLEHKLRTTIGSIDGWVHVVPVEDKRLGPYAIYVKDINPIFVRIVPTPSRARAIFGDEANDY